MLKVSAKSRLHTGHFCSRKLLLMLLLSIAVSVGSAEAGKGKRPVAKSQKVSAAKVRSTGASLRSVGAKQVSVKQKSARKFTGRVRMSISRNANTQRARVGRMINKNVNNYISKNWHRGTFNTVKQSQEYHLRRHSKGGVLRHGRREALLRYTEAAKRLYNQHQGRRRSTIVAGDQPGYKIQKSAVTGHRGGVYARDGRIISYWRDKHRTRFD